MNKRRRKLKHYSPLSEWREAKGLSQQEVEKALGLPRGSLSHFESNSRELRLNPEQYSHYLFLLGIPPDQLRDIWLGMQSYFVKADP
jgi:transcriptional regulator with XRE-family HTH domain